ncbi:hypothetical protein BDZ97DRAFT_1846332 [Flammula alnicola]|nr:hypothetical protein BDZ97DRAFT_1846332 [Flammula alnicola]
MSLLIVGATMISPCLLQVDNDADCQCTAAFGERLRGQAQVRISSTHAGDWQGVAACQWWQPQWHVACWMMSSSMDPTFPGQ